MGKQRTSRLARKVVHTLIDQGKISSVDAANDAYRYLKAGTPELVLGVYAHIKKSSDDSQE